MMQIKHLTKTNLFVNRAMTFMMPVMMLVMNGVFCPDRMDGCHMASMTVQMQVGDMMAFIQYTMQIIMAIFNDLYDLGHVAKSSCICRPCR